MNKAANNENTKEPALQFKVEIELNSRRILSIAQKRVKIFSENIINEVNLNEFVRHVIRLPAAPQATKKIKNSSAKRRQQIKNDWISKMSETQLKSWNYLNYKLQNEYFLTGRVMLGKRQKKQKNESLTLIEASPEKVLKMFNKRKEVWDFHLIDWSIT